MILEKLNEEAMEFVRHFKDIYADPYRIFDLRTQLKFSDKDLYWIVSNVNSINYEILRDGYIADYLKFNRDINNMHIDIAELEAFQAEYLPGNVLKLHDILNVRNDNFKSFDTY